MELNIENFNLIRLYILIIRNKFQKNEIKVIKEIF